MIKYIRHSLATICFAACVGCLWLWWNTISHRSRLMGPSYLVRDITIGLESHSGIAYIFSESTPTMPTVVHDKWRLWPQPIDEGRTEEFKQIVARNGAFGIIYPDEVYFPLWYPALVFALASVGILRIGRFTIRSALVAMTIVATLLGMVVIL